MSEKKYYSGVGSRQTPKQFCELMTKIARYLYFKGYTLRSGGAKNADTAFEIGAGNKKEIYLPFPNYNDSQNSYIEIPQKAFDIAEEIHPAWEKCNDIAKKCHARNCMIALGKDLVTPSDFIVCWTPKGCIVRGTGHILRLAIKYDIPVFNLAKEEDRKRILKSLHSKEILWNTCE